MQIEMPETLIGYAELLPKLALKQLQTLKQNGPGGDFGSTPSEIATIAKTLEQYLGKHFLGSKHAKR